MKTKSRKKELSIPKKIYASHGSFKGEINLGWDAVKKARQYVVQLSAANHNKWKHADIVCEPLYRFIRLKAGHKYSFRVAAVFAEGQGPWSRPVGKKVK